MRALMLIAAFAAFAETARAELPPLIPREVLFGNPERAGPQISPDGKHLAYLRPDDKNVLQVWVRTVGQQDDRAVTADPKRGIRQYYWAYDGKHLLYLQDSDGDENHHLYATNLETKETRDLTPHKGVKVQGVELEEKFPDQVLVGMNKRNKQLFDMHRVTLSTGEEKLDTENPGTVLGWSADADFQVRAAVSMRPDGGQDLLARDKPGAEWKKIRSWSHEEQGGPGGFGTDRNILYATDNLDANTVRLLKIDLGTNKVDVIAEDAEADLSGALSDPRKRTPLAVAYAKARTEWKVLDESVKADFDMLKKLRKGDFAVSSQTADGNVWVVGYTADDGPVTYHLYATNLETKETRDLTPHKGVKLAPMEPVEFTAKDGLTIRGYLTRPPGVESKNLPTVLLVHGGPWARDSWGYNPMAQWLANRGYAVLQVNFRGSTGYGKKYLNAGNREWAGKMHQDLLDGVDYFVKQGTFDPKKVAIMGGSYGGYATLVGLTFTPEVFACGVDIVGPSNIVSLIKAIPPYWVPMKEVFNKRVGDIEKETKFLEERSPLFKADKITKPLLIGQGANDPRVKQVESDQIVEAMRKNKQEVQYVVYPDEGHGFARPENRLHFYAIAEQFLAKHIGGRAEPAGDVKGATGQMK